LIQFHVIKIGKKNHQNGGKSDSDSDSDTDEPKYEKDGFWNETVKLPGNVIHPPIESNEVNPLFKSIFDDLSIRYNITSNGLTHNNIDSFQHLQHIFENAQLRYPNFSNDFTRIMCDHLSKANHTTDTTTNTQLTSGVVKLRI